MKRLSPESIDDLPSTVVRPGYDREALQAGILHFGLGAFHRAHQAVYTDTAIANSGGDWGIVGVSLRSDSVLNQLEPQDCFYSVMSEDGDGRAVRLVGAIKQVLVAPREPEKIIGLIANPGIHLITLTITEKGYCLSADGRSLDTESQAITQDLKNPLQPTSALGLLARGLQQRYVEGGPAISIVSCDNLMENSTLLKNTLVDYMRLSFPEVLPWLQSSVAFPCSMVDRIVPAMNAERVSRQAGLLGLRDEAAVTTEPFSQWIIEDSFIAARPDWESAGVQFVDDIRPYEAIKLGLLNATHSAIAYLGLLAGHTTVDEVVADQKLRAFIDQLMLEDLMPALDVPAEFDLPAYRIQLLERFANPCLQHQCRQIAMDGSEKIAQRWLPALQGSVAKNALVKTLAIWCYFILFTRFDVDDPQSMQLLEQRDSEEPLPSRVQAVLGYARINAQTIENYVALCDVLMEYLELLQSSDVYTLARA